MSPPDDPHESISEIRVFVADAGSAARGNYHWVSSHTPDQSSESPEELAEAIATDLKRGRRVALGYECPLFVPCPAEHTRLGRARSGECQKETGNRPFSAGAGASVLATGIQSLAWVLRRIKAKRPATTATTSWEPFHNGHAELFVWEAFVSGSEKAAPASHVGDAQLAISAFENAAQRTVPLSSISESDVFSLAGAAILYAQLSADDSLLRTPTLVLRPTSHTFEQDTLEEHSSRIDCKKIAPL